jgi:hypothetical protein
VVVVGVVVAVGVVVGVYLNRSNAMTDEAATLDQIAAWHDANAAENRTSGRQSQECGYFAEARADEQLAQKHDEFARALRQASLDARERTEAQEIGEFVRQHAEARHCVMCFRDANSDRNYIVEQEVFDGGSVVTKTLGTGPDLISAVRSALAGKKEDADG